jgi:hypothetical protein
MKRLLSKRQQEKKQRFKQFLIGIILIAVMVFSVLGYSLNSNSENTNKKIVYNGYEFVNFNNKWILNIENFQFGFLTKPDNVTEIYAELNDINSYTGKVLYLQSQESNALSEIYVNLNTLVTRIQPACLNQEECEGNYPIKDCSNNFIIIKESNNTEIYQQDNCVFISGKKQELVNLADSFLLKIIGIN